MLHPQLSLKRWMVVAVTAGLLSVTVPLAGLGVPAQAAVAAAGRGESSDQGDNPSRAPRARDTTTVTVTCGNGFIVFGPIVLFPAPHSSTVIECKEPGSAGGPSRRR